MKFLVSNFACHTGLNKLPKLSLSRKWKLETKITPCYESGIIYEMMEF